MNTWSLPSLLEELHQDIERRLSTARQVFAHPGTKGDASENIWRDLFKRYLPRRYRIEKAHVVDSKNQMSEQIDIVIFDRQYSPFIFAFEDQIVVPAESVYAVFEAKQTINAGLVAYAQKKVASVRNLHRTSLPIPHAGGIHPARLIPVLGGLVTLGSDWTPALGEPFREALNRKDEPNGELDIGCVASHGTFEHGPNGYDIIDRNNAATIFLFTLIARLQENATVPMMDVRAYLKWL
jgi:hypothetical protein